MTTAVDQVKNTFYYSKYFDDTWVDLRNIPLKEWRGKKIYDWKACTEWIEVSFKYRKLEDVLLLKYSHTDKTRHHVTLSYAACTIEMRVCQLKGVELGGLLNLIPIVRPDLIGYFKGGFQEAKNTTYGTIKKQVLVCPNCKHEKQITIQQVRRGGFGCPRCSSGVPFPERFTTALLDEIGFKYETQKRFENSEFRFDFYIPHLKLIVETHGSQHFRNAWCSVQDIVANDREKRLYIKKDLGLNYSAVDISVSEPYYAWNMLEQSALCNYMQNIDCEKVVKRCNEMIVDKNYNTVIEDYKDGMRLCELVRKYDVDDATLVYRLKKAGVFDEGRGLTHMSKSVVCTTTGETFKSAREASRITGGNNSHISENCNGKSKSAGKTSDGRKRVWQFLSDYEQEQN